ncbi:hypothetical protein [Caproiciproducens galactitolivorans]|uniref:hypothetical protein n=1 Tax=Caproiciproducens galactitolivorans TaxID=642589 RepID=UPI002409DBCF|nr:hypothetical protein [Caproiciproducens galactitolivorans]
MKKRRNILSVCLAMLLVFSMATPAMAVVSSKDQSSLSKAQQSAVQKATNDFNNAKSRGDTAGMAAAHAAAEAVRNSSGYSGGSDGSGSTSKSSSSKVDGTTHSSASNASDYNKEADNTASSGNYSSTGHTAKDQQNMAGLSNADTETIAWLEDLYSASSKSGDTATAKAAHSAAEALRNAYGYSGGADGGYYYKDNSSNPGKSTPSGGGNSNPGGGRDDGGTPAGNYTFYNITASAGAGGSISPSGTTTLVKGDSKTFSITPSSGYKISGVKVDGASVGAVSSYTFSNITSGHTISAEFASNASVSVGGAALGDGGSGTLKSGNATKSGYGVTANVSVAASYVSDVTVTASYSFTSAKTVSLENTGGAWQFPVNGTSVTGARKIYIPVETPDDTYTITFHIKALDPQATALTGSNVYLTATKSVTLTIKGSMYEDDFTGNS